MLKKLLQVLQDQIILRDAYKDSMQNKDLMIQQLVIVIVIKRKVPLANPPKKRKAGELYEFNRRRF